MKKGDSFMKLFSSDLQDEIKKFCYRINNSEANVFILMARKAVCFFYILVESGHISSKVSDKTIFCDRVFDLAELEITGDKVAVIDDVVISGSTITKAIRSLNSRGIKDENIEIIVLGVNIGEDDKKYFNKDFFLDERTGRNMLPYDSYAELTNSECLQLCVNISQSLSILGQPHDIDFPHYVDIALPQEAFEHLINSAYWDSYIVSNANHEASGLEVITLIPNKKLLHMLLTKLDFDISRIFYCKVRLFVYQQDGKNLIKIIPIVVLKETSFGYINDFFGFCFLKERGFDEKLNAFKSVTSRVRLLQYYFAHRICEVFFEIVNLPMPAIKEGSIELIFGKANKKLILEILEKTNQIFSGSPKNTICEYNLLGYEQDEILDKESSIYDVNQKLLEPFSYWFDEEEGKARSGINESNYKLIDVDNYNRLEKGFSFNALKHIVSSLSGKYKKDNLISVFLDRAVDLGMIVPILFVDSEKGQISRAFRHGEDFQFTENDISKLDYFYSKIFDLIETKKMTQLEFHKITSLFMQLSEKNALFNKFLGFRNNERLFTVQYCIHGAVPVIIDSKIEDDKIHVYVENDTYADWLINYSLKEKKVRRNKGQVSKKYFSKEDTYIVRLSENIDNKTSKDFVNISHSDKIEISKIADSISKWINYSTESNKRGELLDYMTALTACSNNDMFVSSILAELRIGLLDWGNSVTSVIKSTDQTKMLEFASTLRSRGNENKVFEAINSGRKKSKWFFGIRTKKDISRKKNIFNVTDIIYYVDNILGTYGNADSLNWQGYWSQYLSVKKSQEPLNEELKFCVGFIYLYNICYRILQFLILKMDFLQNGNSGDLAKNPILSKIDNEIKELFEEFLLYGFNENSFDFLLNSRYYELEKQEIKDFLVSLYEFIEAKNIECHEKITIYERYLSIKHNKFTRLFEGSIIIDYLPESNEGDFIKGLSNRFQKFDKKINVRLLDIGDGVSRFSRLLIIFDSDDQNKTAFTIWETISEIATKNGIKNRCLIIPSLPKDCMFRYNILGENQKGIDLFYRNVIMKIEEISKLGLFYEGVLYFTNTIEISNMNIKETVNKHYPFYRMHIGKTGVKMSESDSDKEAFKMTMFCKKTISIGIISILPCEVNAIRNEFALEEVSDPTGKDLRTYFETVAEIADTNYKLTLIQQISPGNMAAVDAFNALKTRAKYDYFFSIGVAGSLDTERLGICDVIIPNAVYDGQSASEEAGGIKYETQVYKISAALQTKLQRFMLDYDGKKMTSAIGSPNPEFKCLSEPIGNNNHVIKDMNSEFRGYIRQVNRKVLAVETESAGAAFAYYTEELSPLEQSKGVLFIRGISDAANIEKPIDNRWHECASINAASTLKLLLPYLS